MVGANTKRGLFVPSPYQSLVDLLMLYGPALCSIICGALSGVILPKRGPTISAGACTFCASAAAFFHVCK